MGLIDVYTYNWLLHRNTAFDHPGGVLSRVGGTSVTKATAIDPNADGNITSEFDALRAKYVERQAILAEGLTRVGSAKSRALERNRQYEKPCWDLKKYPRRIRCCIHHAIETFVEGPRSSKA